MKNLTFNEQKTGKKYMKKCRKNLLSSQLVKNILVKKFCFKKYINFLKMIEFF